MRLHGVPHVRCKPRPAHLADAERILAGLVTHFELCHGDQVVVDFFLPSLPRHASEMPINLAPCEDLLQSSIDIDAHHCLSPTAST